MVSTKISKTLSGKKVLITSGPTWVSIDPMRVMSNRATGELGHKIAVAFNQAGAKVTLIEGPVTCSLQAKEITVKKFCFFDELAALLKSELKKKYDIVIHNAAVSDYKLKTAFKAKLGSGHKVLKLTFVPTEKLINTIKKLAPRTFLVGFKLEDFKNEKEIIAEAKKQITAANCDLVVANTLKGGYKAYLVNKDGKILNHSASRSQLTKRLIKHLKETL